MLNIGALSSRLPWISGELRGGTFWQFCIALGMEVCGGDYRTPSSSLLSFGRIHVGRHSQPPAVLCLSRDQESIYIRSTLLKCNQK